MKTIIAGSREGVSFADVLDAVDRCGWQITEVVSGTARGADRLGEEYAKLNDLPIYRFPADWTQYGRAAGHIRNKVMAQNAEALIALWDGESNGTRNMIDVAKEKGLMVYVYRVGLH